MHPGLEDRAGLADTLVALEAWGRERQWLGPDPYEGLNAQRFRLVQRTPLGRRLLVQLIKRSPLDLRPLFGVPQRHNTVGIANLVGGYVRAEALPADVREPGLDWSLATLERLRLTHDGLPCWGYHFDLETRVFFYPSTRPNTIATAFAGMALLDAFEHRGDRRFLEEAVATAEFFLAHVPQTDAPGGAFFGYFVGDRSPIHNANMLVCGFLARLLRHVERDDFRRAAARSVGYCLAHQRPDGSWPYGERPNLRWVDGFHTGYVLDALIECERTGVDERVPAALRRGLEHYARELFLDDGTAKYYAHETYPIDSQCVAQGIQTFALAAAAVDSAYRSRAWLVFDFARRRMRRRDGAFVFQRRRLWVNPTPHIRWAQAPMFLALAYLAAVDGGGPTASSGDAATAIHR